MTQLVGSILIGDDHRVAVLVGRRIPGFAPERFVGLGVVRGGRLIGGAVFHNYRGHDIEVTIAFDDARWALPGTLRALFAYPFDTLRCARMTAIVGRKNKRSRRLTEGLGFRLEGVARKAMDGKEDAIIYGMLREECRWLGHSNGQEHTRTSRAA